MADAHAWVAPHLGSLAHGTRSFCSWDEDTLTMAVEALRGCLARQKGSHSAVDAVTFASTTAPFADLQNASLLARACGLTAALRTQDSGGSTRAGVSALVAALKSPAPGDDLLVAADNRKARAGSVQEFHYGAGAAAVQVSAQNVIASYLGSHSTNSVFIDHYRTRDSDYDYYWEERWVRDEGYGRLVPDTVIPLLEATATKAEDIRFFCMPGHLPRLGSLLARKIGIPQEAVVDNHAGDIGDTGTPQPLLMLATALEQARPGDRILVVGFGAGCDALLLEATDAVVDRQGQGELDLTPRLPPSEHYTQFLVFQGELEQDAGIRAETDNRVALSQLYRAQDQVVAFQAGVCSSCGAVQFPALATCVRCGSTEPMGTLPLADEPAKVATFTADRLQYYPAPPMYWGLVQFDNGARLLMEMVEVDPAAFDAGSPLRMVYRIKQKDRQRGLHRYFWKAAPARES